MNTQFGKGKIHVIGAGGVSMAPLCEALQMRGFGVIASDRAENKATERLRLRGIDVRIGEDPAFLDGCGGVVRTAAAKEDNPIVAEARRRNLPLRERAEVWGWIMRDYRHAVCVAGTHGKTTTTGMITQIALEARLDPAVMMGGSLPILDGLGHRTSQTKDWIILEACEYSNSFHHFNPTTAILLNVEHDHPDCFPTMDDVLVSFRGFICNVPPEGLVVANHDDPNVRDVLKDHKGHVAWFGLEHPPEGHEICSSAYVTVHNVVWKNGFPAFDLVQNGKTVANINLGTGGVHNLKNALAAAAVMLARGISPEAIRNGLEAFRGAGRRMEFVGKTASGMNIYDDYAHHPTEIAAALALAKEMCATNLVCVFQPHTFSRTKAFFDDFTDVFRKNMPQTLIFLPIYAARETNIFGVSSAELAAAVPGSIYCADFDAATDMIHQVNSEMLLTIGAGDVCNIGLRVLDDNN